MPLFILTVVVGRVLFLGAVLLLVAVATVEFYGLAESKRYRPRLVAGLGLAVAIPLLLYGAPLDAGWTTIVLTAGIIGIAASQMLDHGGPEAIASIAVTIFGALYTGLLFGHFVLIREVAREIPGAPYWIGALLIAMPVVLTWLNDTVAYFAGNAWGKRRLAPIVSPGKTVAGAVVALIATTIGGGGVAIVIHGWFPPIGWGHGVAVGAVVGVAAPIGDLIESAFKRDAGVKDVSQVVPGHGGVLDRFDALMVSAPAFYYYLTGVIL